MTEQAVIKAIREIVAQKFYKLPEDVNLNTVFTQDLRADSLDMLELCWDICKTYNIPNKAFEEELAQKNITAITVDDCVTAACKLLGIKRGPDKEAAILWLAVTTKKGANMATTNKKFKAITK